MMAMRKKSKDQRNPRHREDVAFYKLCHSFDQLPLDPVRPFIIEKMRKFTSSFLTFLLNERSSTSSGIESISEIYMLWMDQFLMWESIFETWYREIKNQSISSVFIGFGPAWICCEWALLSNNIYNSNKQ